MLKERTLRRIEIASNITILVCGVLAALLFAGQLRVFVARGNSSMDSGVLKPGSTLSLQGVDWAASDRTLLLVLSTHCRFCTQSLPFYATLTDDRTRFQRLRMIAALPEALEVARDYLMRADVRVDRIVRVKPSAIRISGTPTLILVGRDGTVRKIWAGRLSAARQSQVVRYLATAPR